jgi:hypothetical protein
MPIAYEREPTYLPILLEDAIFLHTYDCRVYIHNDDFLFIEYPCGSCIQTTSNAGAGIIVVAVASSGSNRRQAWYSTFASWLLFLSLSLCFMNSVKLAQSIMLLQ